MNNFYTNNDLVRNVIEKQLSDENIESTQEYNFNPLKMYFGEDYIVNDEITIHQPTIQDFIEAEDETKIYDVIKPFIANTTAYRVQLWDKGIDWNKLTNIELFSVLIKQIDFKYSQLIFGEVDFSSFDLLEIEKENGETEPFLYSKTMDLGIDEATLKRICKHIQYMFNIFPVEEEFTSSKILKQDLINKDRQNQIVQQKKESARANQSLLSMITFYLNHPGCKYKKNELREMGYFEFMYNIQRIQIYESTHALFGGIYSGMCDLSKVNPNGFNFMRDIKISA